ncbi:ferredoxin [Acidisphaera sp. S103]|uniref:ferredoxin n=1 Tax=Acidisphaera sp. S103 TaxID=1747223 RepID=UPI00131A71B9|nr:ferredoxin [Acidisphaera sp. S103]
MTYVILTSKPGVFHTEPDDAVRPCETYDYVFHGQRKARFIIAELLRPTKLRIVDETPPEVTTLVPSKFLPGFSTIEAARRELQQLSGRDMVLERLP